MSRTQHLLTALGQREGFALLEALRSGPLKQTELAKRAHVPAGTASARVELLEALGLITRESSRSPLHLTRPLEYDALISAVDHLAELLLADELAAQERRRPPMDGETPGRSEHNDAP